MMVLEGQPVNVSLTSLNLPEGLQLRCVNTDTGSIMLPPAQPPQLVPNIAVTGKPSHHSQTTEVLNHPSSSVLLQAHQKPVPLHWRAACDVQQTLLHLQQSLAEAPVSARQPSNQLPDILVQCHHLQETLCGLALTSFAEPSTAGH